VGRERALESVYRLPGHKLLGLDHLPSTIVTTVTSRLVRILLTRTGSLSRSLQSQTYRCQAQPESTE